MAYKDPEKQREAVRQAVKRHRQGITSEGITGPVLPVRLDPNAEWGAKEIMALSPGQAKAVLSSWAVGNGTEYQRRMGVLAQHYSQQGLQLAL